MCDNNGTALAAALPPAVVQAAQTRGKHLDLEQTGAGQRTLLRKSIRNYV